MRPDQQPGFWPTYRAPASHLAAAIQYPMTDALWAERVVTCYMRDWREAKRANRPTEGGDKDAS